MVARRLQLTPGVGRIVGDGCVTHSSRMRALAVFGLCLTIVSMLYLMLTLPEQSVAVSTQHLREMTIPNDSSDHGRRLQAILMNLEYVGHVQVHLLRVILTTLLILTIVFIALLIVSARLKRTLASAGGNT
jgi:hypothetical protein